MLENFQAAKNAGTSSPPAVRRKAGGSTQAEELYRTMGRVFGRLDSFGFYIITSHPDFEKCFEEKRTRTGCFTTEGSNATTTST
jgi:putative N6-adenine-specific DNA methylase